ncbi:MAG: hypothetical protein PVF33_10980, partial [Candidatus Latescibacterota bacterium]
MIPRRRIFSALVLGSCLAFVLGTVSTAWAQFPPHVWSERFGDADDQYCEGVAADASGNIIVVGSFQGSADFGGGTLTSAGGYDIFIAKYDEGGSHIWSQRFGDEGDQNAGSVAVDGGGNVTVTGQFEGTVNFGGGPLASSGGLDMFVAKFDAAGNHIWSQRFGDASGLSTNEWGETVLADGSGNVVVTGRFDNTVNFGGETLTNAGSLPGTYIVKFSGAGDHLWSQRVGGTGMAGAINPLTGVAVDGSGNVILTGNFVGTVDFGGGPLVSAGGGGNVFVAKFDENGGHVWSRSFGDIFGQYGRGAGADGSGNVFVTGSFVGTVDFGGGPLTSANGTDMFVA